MTGNIFVGLPDVTIYHDVEETVHNAPISLAWRYLEPRDEIADQGAPIATIVKELAPELVARPSVGMASAARLRLRLAAGDNPVPAPSGKTARHRLTRGGDRTANSDLHIISPSRFRLDTEPQDGIAREVFNTIVRRQKEINQSQIAT